MTYTHTYATMDVSERTFNEIAEKMVQAGYEDQFVEADTIDMHGIAVVAKEAQPARGKLWYYLVSGVFFVIFVYVLKLLIDFVPLSTKNAGLLGMIFGAIWMMLVQGVQTALRDIYEALDD